MKETVSIAVVEDEVLYADTIRKYLARYETEHGLYLHADFYADGDEIAEPSLCEEQANT